MNLTGKFGVKPPTWRQPFAAAPDCFNPNSEVAAAMPVDSTGHWPVSSGDPPLGTGTARELFHASVATANVLPVPSGQWPDGTGGSPMPPISISEFGFRFVRKPQVLPLARGDDTGTDFRRGLASLVAGNFPELHLRHFHVQINPVKQRPGNPAQVILNLAR